jgi:hypothetical protein
VGGTALIAKDGREQLGGMSTACHRRYSSWDSAALRDIIPKYWLDQRHSCTEICDFSRKGANDAKKTTHRRLIR